MFQYVTDGNFKKYLDHCATTFHAHSETIFIHIQTTSFSKTLIVTQIVKLAIHDVVAVNAAQGAAGVNNAGNEAKNIRSAAF